MGVKATLKAITLELRRELEGRHDAQGTWKPGDLERRLGEIGVWRDRAPKPADEIAYRVPDDRNARRVVDAFLQSRVAAGQSREASVAEFVRDAAYTWANRLLALRCMEARSLIDEVILQKDAYGGRSLQHMRLAKKQPERCAGDDEGLFAVLFGEFERRSEELPLLFDPRATEVALRPSVAALKHCIALLSGTIAAKGQEQATDDVFAAPDALGWAYQYWNTEEKARVFEKIRTRKGSKIEGAEIVPATCIYTEPYMVKFLVQNSLGAMWVGMHPSSRLVETWEYFVRDADRAPVSNKPVKQITFLDPACGSGHFLIEAFELFYAMYLEEGVLTDPAAICTSILEYNIFGIDIDERAVQIAAFALVMKAKEKDPDFVARRVNLVATNIRLPADKEHVSAFLQKHPEDAPLKPALLAIFEDLAHADEIGSLLQIEEHVDRELRHLREEQLARERNASAMSLFEPRKDEDWSAWKQQSLRRLREHFNVEARDDDLAVAFFGEAASKGLSLVDLLVRRYDVVAANPPYMGSKNMGAVLKLHVERHFCAGKRDLYAAFILRCSQLAAASGRVAMVTQQSWMFLRSYAALRVSPHQERTQDPGGGDLLRNAAFETLVHLGRYAFSEIGNAAVAPVMFVFHKDSVSPHHRLWACRLTAPRESYEQAALVRAAVRSTPSSLVSRPVQSRFLSLPESPICYWLPERLMELLAGRSLASVAKVVQGIATGENDRFVRFVWEVMPKEWARPLSVRRWVPFEKGGGYGKWFGHHWWTLEWERAGARIRATPGPRIQNENHYFKAGWTYSGTASGSLAVRQLEGAIWYAVHSDAVIFHRGDSTGLGAVLNARMASASVRWIRPQLDLSGSYVSRIPIPENVPAHLAEFESTCITLKQYLVRTDPSERTFVSNQLSGTSLREAHANTVKMVEAVAAVLHALEGCSERAVFDAYGIENDDRSAVLEETGTPAGWYPLIPGYDAWPKLPEALDVPSRMLELACHQRYTKETPNYLSEIRQRIRDLYLAGPGKTTLEEDFAPVEDEEIDNVVSGARVPIPTETFVEELSQRLQIHPISVYWLIDEVREQGFLSKPELVRFVEDRMSVMVLSLLGHRWPLQIEAEAPIPAWVDRDGVIPITEGTAESALLVRIRRRLASDFGPERCGDIEREFQEITGKSLAAWLETDFFKRHVSQFWKRPIAWQLTSRGSNTKRRGRGNSQNAPAFACFIYYHALNADLLPKLRTQYVGPLRASLQTELGSLEKVSERSTDQDSRRLEIEGKLEELRAFDERLQHVIVEGFASPTLDSLLSKEPLDTWTSRDGRTRTPETRDAFVAQERRFDPDLNDGVRVNSAPLQRAGLLAADVLPAKEVERAIADRAEWRMAERHLCREGKLPQPGWWPVTSKTIEVPAVPDAILDLEPAVDATVLVCALLHASNGSLAHMDLARAFALRSQPELVQKLAAPEFQTAARTWANRAGKRTVPTGLLASVLSDLASRNVIQLTTDRESRSIVTAAPYTPTEDKIDAWFRFEARLMLSMLSTLQPPQIQEVEASIAGDDRKLLAAGAA